MSQTAYLVALIDVRESPVLAGIHIFGEEKPTLPGHFVPSTLYAHQNLDFASAAKDLIAFLKKWHPTLYAALDARDLMLE